MSLPLFNFPSLVQSVIFKRMPLADNFIVSTLSKRARGIIRSCFATQQLLLAIKEDGDFRLSRGGMDYFLLEFYNIEKLKPPYYELRNFSNAEIVPIKMDFANFVETYWADEKAALFPAIEYFARTFPKLKVDLDVEVVELDRFVEKIRLFKNLNVKLGHIFVMTSEEFDDELVKVALEECKDAESLHLDVPTSPDFEYEGVEPFQFRKLAIDQSSWVTRDHFLNLFMNCESLTLGNVELSVEDYKAIFRKWIEGSKMKKLEVKYPENTISPIFDKMEGVVGVRKAEQSDSIGYKAMKFGPGQAYQITQEDGTAAIVYKLHQCLYLNTDFEIQ